MCNFYKALILILALSVATLPLTGCGDDEETFTTETDSEGGDPDDGDEDDGDGETPAPEEFELNVSTSGLGWLSLLHKSTAIGDKCSVAPGTSGAADQYITCYLDIQEGSAYASEVDLNFKVPPQMCRYLQHNPYTHINWQTGSGPTNIWIQTNTNAAGDILGYECAETIIPPAPTAMFPCNGFTEWKVDNGAEICQYNHSQRDDAYPNCCSGGYNLRTRTYDVDSLEISNVDVQSSNWGDTSPACYGGPASRDPEWPLTDSGIPMRIIYQTWNEGIDQTYKFRSPLALTKQFSSTNGESANVASYNDFTGATPLALNPAYTDLSGDPVQTFSGAAAVQRDYEFWCMDEAFEIKYSINLRLREWNTTVEYTSLLETGTGDPNITGIEGTNCEFESPEAGACNDKRDWDDIVGGADLYPEHLWE